MTSNKFDDISTVSILLGKLQNTFLVYTVAFIKATNLFFIVLAFEKIKLLEKVRGQVRVVRLVQLLHQPQEVVDPLVGVDRFLLNENLHWCNDLVFWFTGFSFLIR